MILTKDDKNSEKHEGFGADDLFLPQKNVDRSASYDKVNISNSICLQNYANLHVFQDFYQFYEPDPPTDEQQDGGYQQHHYPSPPHHHPPPPPYQYPGPRQRRNGGFRSSPSVGGFPDIFADGSTHFTTIAPFRSGFK